MAQPRLRALATPMTNPRLPFKSISIMAAYLTSEPVEQGAEDQQGPGDHERPEHVLARNGGDMQASQKADQPEDGSDKEGDLLRGLRPESASPNHAFFLLACDEARPAYHPG